MSNLSNKAKEFNDFRFEGLDWYQQSNKYLSMNRVSKDENKVVVKVADCHLISTRFGYALILDESHVVFLKSWQVSSNYYGNEVLLQRNFFDVKEWGDFSDNFGENPDNLDFNCWVETARAQDAYTDEEGDRLNVVKWEI